jgi:hypothetical protein
MAMKSFVHDVLYVSMAQQAERQDILYAKDQSFPSSWRQELMEGVIPSFIRWMGETDFSKMNENMQFDVM